MCPVQCWMTMKTMIGFFSLYPYEIIINEECLTIFSFAKVYIKRNLGDTIYYNSTVCEISRDNLDFLDIPKYTQASSLYPKHSLFWRGCAMYNNT